MSLPILFVDDEVDKMPAVHKLVGI